MWRIDKRWPSHLIYVSLSRTNDTEGAHNGLDEEAVTG